MPPEGKSRNLGPCHWGNELQTHTISTYRVDSEEHVGLAWDYRSYTCCPCHFTPVPEIEIEARAVSKPGREGETVAADLAL